MFEERGYVLAQDETEASKYIMEEHSGEGSVDILEETHVITLDKEQI